jgi:endonuclease/exonuclease/phosphatase (EEP) superfamily protein YafD
MWSTAVRRARARGLFPILLVSVAAACRDDSVREVDAYDESVIDTTRELVLVTWNLHKETGRTGAEQLGRIFAQEAAVLVALQEARSSLALPEALGAHFAASFRWVPWAGANGVMTVGAARPTSARPAPASLRELYVTTPKAALITTHALSDGRSLMLVNVHAMLFGSQGRRFRVQLEGLARAMERHTGPLLFCGDFNTWSAQRLAILQEVTAGVGLVEVPKPDGEGCTVRLPWPLDSMLGLDEKMHLDRVFYRGLELVEQRWLGEYDVSDHLPLLARFRFE